MHFDRPAGALLRTQAAGIAVVVIKLEAISGTELLDRIAGANLITIVAFKTVSAGEASPGL